MSEKPRIALIAHDKKKDRSDNVRKEHVDVFKSAPFCNQHDR